MIDGKKRAASSIAELPTQMVYAIDVQLSTASMLDKLLALW